MKLTIRECVKKLEKVSAQTLYLAVENKKIAHYRVSGSGKKGKILIEEADLDAWMERQKVSVEEPTATRSTELRHISLP